VECRFVFTPDAPDLHECATWAAATRPGRGVFNYNYRLVGVELPGRTLVDSTEAAGSAGVLGRAYLWSESRHSGAPGSLRVLLCEAADWGGAQAALVERAAARPWPTSRVRRGRLRRLGDLCLASDAVGFRRIRTAVHFARGNMAVLMASVGKVQADVTPLAGRIDRQLIREPKGRDLWGARSCTEVWLRLCSIRRASRTGC
jgi:hypothetical protein